MADLKNIVGKNREFTGTKGVKVSSGATSANRSDEEGRLRYNETTNLMEFYTGVEWKLIDTPPVVSQLKIDGRTDTVAFGTSVAIDSTQSGNASIEIIGDFFDSGASAVFLPTTGSTVTPVTTTYNSSTSITVTVPYSSFLFANEPYSAKVTNSSGLFATGASLTVDTPLVFNNAENSIGYVYDSTRGSVSTNVAQATDPEADTITYSLTAGSLPSGLSLNSSSGLITGSTAAVGSQTDSTFTVTAVSSSASTSSTTTKSRQFIIRQLTPQSVSYTSGSGTFSVPEGLTSLDVLVVGNGGNAGGNHCGGGGGGGLIFRPGFPVSPGGSIAYNLGSLEARSPEGPNTRNGSVTFGPLTAIAGGTGKNGGGGPPSSNTASQAGGSGAGGTHSPSSTHGGNPAIQPLQAGDSGTYGFGHAGGAGNHSPTVHAAGGGGGGAGASGTGGINPAGNGGAGRAYTISGSSVHYAGGGGGGNHNGGNPGSGGTGGGGTQGDGTNGLGGGAGSNNEPSTPGFIGGTGVIWISY